MPLFAIVVRFAFRNRLRALITSLGVAATLLTFVVLRTLVANWYTVNHSAAKDTRMIIRNRISIMFPLRATQAERLRQVPGVRDVSWLCWFAGKYKGVQEPFGQQAVDSESFLRMYPEYVPRGEQKQAWLEDLTGALVGRKLARREGWKVGDRVVLEGTIYPGIWTFTIRGIYSDADPSVNAQMFFFHYKHLDQTIEWSHGHVQRLLAKVDGPEVAKAIDRAFEHDAHPTKTDSEFATEREWSSWSSGVIGAIDAGSILVLLVMALVLGNAMSMATREASREYACMRAIGYKPRHILALVLGEGALVAAIGIALGLAVASPVLTEFSKLMADQLGGSWELALPPSVVATGSLVGLAVGALSAAWPAWRSSRARIADSLRTIA